MKRPAKTLLRLFEESRRLKREAVELLRRGDMSLYVKKLFEITELQMQMQAIR